MKTKRFLHKNLNCEYVLFGHGERVLYAFHGFGQSASIWKVFETWLASQFTIYSFVDFFHGEHLFPESRLTSDPLKKTEITELYSAFAMEMGHEKISLMAYSSGARIALTLLERFDVVIDEVWLFAPDGIRRSFWNKIFCKYSWIQSLYLKICENPTFFFSTVKQLRNIGMIDRSFASFVLFSMRTKDKRLRVYNYWMTYRDIIPNIELVAKNSLKRDVNIHFIFGDSDTVIPSEIGKAVLRDYEIKADLFLVSGGHDILVLTNQAALKHRFGEK